MDADEVVDDLISRVVDGELEDLCILTARAGHEAFDLFRRADSVDLVVAAHELPDVTGLDLLNRLKQMASATRCVLFVTGSPGLLDPARACGVAALERPVDREQLAAFLDPL